MENVNTENSLGTEKLSKLFITIVLPSVLAMLIIGTQSMIDGLFLGNFVGANAMASVNIAMPFTQVGSGIGMMISIGGTAYIGRMLGAEKFDIAQDIFKTAFISLLISSIILMIIGVFFSDEISIMLGANEILLEDSSTYIKTVTLLLPALLIYFLTSFTNRIIGKSNLFLMATIGSVVSNVILNYLFIVVCDFGVRGAGFATGLAYTIGLLINIAPILNRKSIVNIFVGKFDFKILGKVCYNGSSEGVTSVAMAVTTFIFNVTFMNYYQEAGVSAFTIISYIAQITNSIIFGVVDGMSPIVSYNYGANAKERVQGILKISFIANLIIGIVAYIVIVVFGKSLIGFFADGDLELIELTYEGAKLYSTMFFISGANILVSSYFTAIGEAMKSIAVSASRGLIFIILGVLILPKFLGVIGVWLVAPFADLVTLVVCIFLLSKDENLKKVKS